MSSYDSLFYEMQLKFEAIKDLSKFLEDKFNEHGKDWADEIDFNNIDFRKLAGQACNEAKTRKWYIPLTCNYLVLLIYSVLEDTLNRLCKEVESELGLNTTLFDFPGKGIERATKYLSKAAGLSDIRNNKLWQKIEEWATVRNIIAHTNGRINKPKDRDKIPNTININEISGEIMLDFSDVNDFYTISRMYLEYVFQQLS